MGPTTQGGFRQDLRELLRPEKKWHYAFALVVVLAASFYWVAAPLKHADASWAEIVMYRPGGDNQVFPVITALSRLNFGDPTDAFHYGEGVGGFHAVILLPHALAYAVLGAPGYWAADVAFSLLYFFAAGLLLKGCGFGRAPSLALASALATGSLQALSAKVNQALMKIGLLLGHIPEEWDFPSLLTLPLFNKRVPRPMVTEICLVLLLCLLWRFWRDRTQPSLKQGLAMGSLMAVLIQGDPFSGMAMGLLLLAVVAWVMSGHRWRPPWRFAAGLAIGGLALGWYFLWQLAFQDPESAARFGLAPFSRGKIWLLTGYAPALRLCVVALMALAVVRAARWSQTAESADQNPALAPVIEPPAGHKHRQPKGPAKARQPEIPTARDLLAVNPRPQSAMVALATFCLVLLAAAWLAQPVQLFLLGQGAQIYHYDWFMLPTLYGYAVLLLACALVKLLTDPIRRALGAATIALPKAAAATVAGLWLAGQFLLGIEEQVDAIMRRGTARPEIMPWEVLGDLYRPSFRALDREFRNNPDLQRARTFATFCHEVNFLLTAFHDKRAYLPDNGFTTLSDHELERRLSEMGKILALKPLAFSDLIQNRVILNYWLGCAKYWFTPRYHFAPVEHYTRDQRLYLSQMPESSAFSVALPQSEVSRLVNQYIPIIARETPIKEYPEVIIMTVLLEQQQAKPHPQIYREVYRNAVFAVYLKLPHESAATFAYKLPPNPMDWR